MGRDAGRVGSCPGRVGGLPPSVTGRCSLQAWSWAGLGRCWACQAYELLARLDATLTERVLVEGENEAGRAHS